MDDATAPTALHGEPPYPQRLAFVLKLHRDCAAGGARLAGRVEHPASGRQALFDDADALCRWLHGCLADAARP